MRTKAIDWGSVRARLARNRAAMDTALSPDSGRIQAVYRERAARLARPPEGGEAGGEELPMLVFRLGTGRYGIELAEILEVLPHPRCAPVPGGPPQLAGVLQVRGEIRPVWDLARLLELPDLRPDDTEYVLLLRNRKTECGLLVNRVEGIQTFRPGPGLRARLESRHAKWVTADLITILDPAGLWKEES